MTIIIFGHLKLRTIFSPRLLVIKSNSIVINLFNSNGHLASVLQPRNQLRVLSIVGVVVGVSACTSHVLDVLNKLSILIVLHLCDISIFLL